MRAEQPRPGTEGSDGLLSLDQLTERVGMSVRTVRFYTSRGLVPPPVRQGRSGRYTAEHVVRLELVSELQAHGFTLAAIERYMARIPADATPETIALHRTLVAPLSAPAELVSRRELETRAGRPLTDDDVRVLEQFGAVTPNDDGTYLVSGTLLTIALQLVQVGWPIHAAQLTAQVFRAHGRQIAEELTDIFRTHVWPAMQASGAGHDEQREILQRLKPMTIAALVGAYEEAVDEMRRESIARRAQES